MADLKLAAQATAASRVGIGQSEWALCQTVIIGTATTTRAAVLVCGPNASTKLVLSKFMLGTCAAASNFVLYDYRFAQGTGANRAFHRDKLRIYRKCAPESSVLSLAFASRSRPYSFTRPSTSF